MVRAEQEKRRASCRFPERRDGTNSVCLSELCRKARRHDHLPKGINRGLEISASEEDSK